MEKLRKKERKRTYAPTKTIHVSFLGKNRWGVLVLSQIHVMLERGGGPRISLSFACFSINQHRNKKLTFLTFIFRTQISHELIKILLQNFNQFSTTFALREECLKILS